MAKKRANGEGSIRKRKDGRWEGRYTVGYDPDTGKRVVKNVLGKTQAEVKAKMAAAMEELKLLDPYRSGEYTVLSWLRSWFELYSKPNIRPGTVDYYERDIEHYVGPRIGDIKLNKLTARDLQKLYNDLLKNGRVREVQKAKNPGLSTSTVRGIHMMLHSALDRAVKERLILRNPTEDCIVPKLQKPEMKILPAEGMRSYLTAAEEHGVLPMFYPELTSGLRKGELAALLWTDLDVERGIISVSKQVGRDRQGNVTVTRPKTDNSVRKVSIPQEAVDLLVKEHAQHPGNRICSPHQRLARCTTRTRW